MANFSFLISCLLPLLVLLSLRFLFLYLLTPTKNSTKGAKLPPSPPRLPIIGNLHQLGKLPHQSLWQLSKQYGPIMLLQLGHIPTLVISSPAMAKQVLKTYDTDFCSRPHTPGARKLAYNLSDVAFSPYGDHWRRMRKLFVSELFNSNREQSFWRAREVEIDNLINNLSLLSPNIVNFDDKMFSLVGGVIGAAAFGERYGEKRFEGKNLKDVLDEAMMVLSTFSAEDFFPWIGWIVDFLTGQRARLEKSFSNLDGYFRMVLEDHLEPSRPEAAYEDLVSTVVRLSKDETSPFRLSNNNIKAVLMNTFLGGTDTSAVTLVWAMSRLVKDPRVMQKVQHEIRGRVGKKPRVEADDLSKLTYLKMVLKETLRLHPAAPFLIPHQSVRHCEINDTQGNSYNIYPKTRVLINSFAIGRDPNSWKNPNEFYPERFENSEIDFRGTHLELLPFGAGRRMCPAISSSMATMEFTLANLLYCFDWVIPSGMKREDISMEEESGLTIHRKTPLCLVPIKYNWKD